MNTNLKILLIDPDDSFLSGLEETLNSMGFNACFTAKADAPINQLEILNPDLAILGPSLDLELGLRCIHKLKIIDLAIPILVYSDDDGLSGGPAGGPFDGLHALGPDINSDEISETIEKALTYKAQSEVRPGCPILIGQGGTIKRIRQKILNVADKDITVLVTGESGTGKELIARSIHFYSERNKGPLLKIGCGTLPDELLESEVFGFQKGAFTDAHQDKPGRLELAHGGTLFVDEIGDLSLSLQAKFLQVLEDKVFSRLGGTLDQIIDARVVAATNTDLTKMVSEGTFRKDLFYRLNVVNIEAPALRERREDILLLTHYFLNKYCYELKKEPLIPPDEVKKLILAYRWPGNVRELENVIRRAIAMRSWSFIFEDLPLEDGIHNEESIAPSGDDSSLLSWDDGRVKGFFKGDDFSLKKISKAYVSEAECVAISKALKETNWNRKKAAELLRISYKTLLNRILEFDLQP